MPKHIMRPKVILPPPKHAGRIINVQQQSTVTDVMATALGIIKQQVDNLSAKSRMGGALPAQEAKNLRIYVQSLMELSREERERTKHDGIEDWLAEMSTDELIEMAQGKLGTTAALENSIEVPHESTTEPVLEPEDINEIT